jgi:hypothetical protein
VEPRPVAPPIEAEPPVRLSAAGSLQVTDQGVGRRVSGKQLVGAGDRFAPGTSVSYWTRIEGGAAGQAVYHVWLHEGLEVRRMRLSLGGPHWRTHSRKSLGPDAGGVWTVETRDDSGQVLARSEFLCIGD